MSGKRLRARKRHARTRVWAITATILMAWGLVLFLFNDHDTFLWVSGGIGLSGLVVSWWQDRSDLTVYAVEGENLLLSRNGITERVPMSAVLDASLVDRRASREFLLARKQAMQEDGFIPAERDEFQRQFLKWCTVDIGVGRFAMGRDMLERRPDGKYDLVLLRLQGGRSLLLSPVYNQDLISALNKGKGGESHRRQHRA